MDPADPDPQHCVPYNRKLTKRPVLNTSPVHLPVQIEVSRKACIERLTDIWCSELKRHRLTAYR